MAAFHWSPILLVLASTLGCRGPAIGEAAFNDSSVAEVFDEAADDVGPDGSQDDAGPRPPCGTKGSPCCPWEVLPSPPRDPGTCNADLGCFWTLTDTIGICVHCGLEGEPCCARTTCAGDLGCFGGEDSSTHCDRL
jgi:hypothetical protein